MKTGVLFFLVSMLMYSCSSHPDEQKTSSPITIQSGNDSEIGSLESGNDQKQVNQGQNGSWKWSDCVRGEPEAVCMKKAFKSHSFRVDSTSSSIHIGHEKVTLKNGDILEIKNSGCEYYALEFKFTTAHFKADTTDLVYWCDAALQLMKSIEKGVDDPFSLEDSYPVLEKFYLESESPALGEEKQFNDSEIGNYISLERIEKVSTSKYSVTVQYLVGPL